ncbi:MAG: CHAP domain-containing protein, partial [Nonomuraea sp.]|nr:CHAP domain-containing protein [Nonomuraea sp.]
MSPEMKKYLDLLESQLGYSEKGGAYTKFGDWYGKNVEFDADYSGAPWCDMFLSWAADKLGYQDWIGQFAFTQAHAEWFKEHDAWGRKPEPGALVFYDWGGSRSIDSIDHVGIVTRVEGDKIFTIEGNIDGGVAKRKERDTSKVVGFGYPERIRERQAEKALAKKQAEEVETPSADPEVGKLQLPENDLASLLRQPEAALEQSVPLAAGAPAARPVTSPAGSPSAAASPSTSGSAAKAGTPKKAKHAKPATADTQAETTQPLPVITDVAAAAPVPALNSPTLLGSAVVAALAILAVAKTRHRRVRPATAAAVATPTRGHRRKPRRSPTRAPSTGPAEPRRTRTTGPTEPRTRTTEPRSSRTTGPTEPRRSRTAELPRTRTTPPAEPGRARTSGPT